jgi:hypothetical protein
LLKRLSFLHYIFWVGFLCQKSNEFSYMDLFLVFRSVPLIIMSVLVPVPWCFYHYGSVVSLKSDIVIPQHCSFCLGLPSLFEVFCSSIWTLGFDLISF